MLPGTSSNNFTISLLFNLLDLSRKDIFYMDNSSPFHDLTDDQLAKVAGGHHSHSHSHSHHKQFHGHHHGNTYITNNYYVINSTDTQISSGSSRNNNNNGTSVSLG